MLCAIEQQIYSAVYELVLVHRTLRTMDRLALDMLDILKIYKSD